MLTIVEIYLRDRDKPVVININRSSREIIDFYNKALNTKAPTIVINAGKTRHVFRTNQIQSLTATQH